MPHSSTLVHWQMQRKPAIRTFQFETQRGKCVSPSAGILPDFLISQKTFDEFDVTREGSLPISRADPPLFFL